MAGTSGFKRSKIIASQGARIQGLSVASSFTAAGLVSLGTATAAQTAGDLNAVYLSYGFGTVDTTVAVTHGLGAAPKGWFVCGIDKGGVVYKITAAATTTLKLGCTATSATAKVIAWT